MTTTMRVGNLHTGDVAVIALYLIGSLILGMYTILKSKASIQSLFLAGRSLSWWPIGFSLFASNIGSINFVGIAGDAAASGLAVIMFEWNATILLVMLGWVFLPVYISSGVYTMPEYLGLRFGGNRLRIYLSVIALLTYVFATVPADLYSGALFMNQSLKINIYAAVAILLFITLIFNGLGGMETVIVTDALAAVVMVIGGIILFAIGMVKVGGWESLKDKYMKAIPNTSIQTNSSCGYPREDAFHIFRHPGSSVHPSVGLLLRTTIGALWYWCANQTIVQRSLAAKNISHARAGCVLAGYLKLLPLIFMILPGMISRALYPDEVACADPDTCMRVCGSPVGCSNIALPKLVIELLPTGIRGLLVATMIAAVVSSLTSIFNSASAIFTLDIWPIIRKHASPRELVIASRISVLVMIGIAIIWIPVMSQAEGGQIFMYASLITGYLSAPTCAIFVLAMLWGRMNEKGAFYSVILAQSWGLVRFILDLIYPAPSCYSGLPDDRPKIVSNFHGFYHSVSQIALAFLAAVVFSLITEAPIKSRISGLTYWTRNEKPHFINSVEENKNLKSRIDDDKIEIDEIPEQQTVQRNNISDEDNIPSSNPKSDSITKETLEIQDVPGYSQGMDPGSGIAIINEEELDGNADCGCMTLISHMKTRLIQAVCGSPQATSQAKEEERVTNYFSRITSLKQPERLKDFININAAIVIMLTAFLYGLFF